MHSCLRLVKTTEETTIKKSSLLKPQKDVVLQGLEDIRSEFSAGQIMLKPEARMLQQQQEVKFERAQFARHKQTTNKPSSSCSLQFLLRCR